MKTTEKVSGWALCKEGMFWGCIYSDARSTEYGWVSEIDKIKLDTHSKEMPPTKTWFTYQNSHYAKEMNTGHWVVVEITKQLEIVNEKTKEGDPS